MIRPDLGLNPAGFRVIWPDLELNSVHNRFNALNNIWLNLREGKQTLTMLLKQLNKGHLGQSVKIVCCICKTVYYSESISSSKPVNTSEFSLNFV